ncbi:hypothetical protein EW026_g4250 [Hermanssonia centrifuga]|uniref:Serine hydrolase domain-containing protein n=1 Tax=Hermanssonia centrifuga TaxID=98765 RepID=A0A4S4KHS3_9APHY|nr:hypothetical protein EW026_g4250 [Hermanssonia centrifuga]
MCDARSPFPVFLDAPHVLSPVDLAETFNTPEELGAPEAAQDADPALMPRGWWKVDAKRTNTNGLEASFDLLRDVLKKDHYDGVLGFSQGAAMAALLAALLQKPDTYPAFLVDGKPPHPPLSFCIAVAGFKPPGPTSDALFLPSYSTQTLHVLGKNDVIVVEERSKTLLDVSSNKRVEWHDGGHFVPSKASWRNFFRDYIRQLGSDVPSPGLAGISQPPSGAVTPSTPAGSGA